VPGPKFKYYYVICPEGLKENRRKTLIRVSDLNQGCVEYGGSHQLDGVMLYLGWILYMGGYY